MWYIYLRIFTCSENSLAAWKVSLSISNTLQSPPITFTLLDGKGPLTCRFAPVVLSPLRKGAVSVGKIGIDTGAMSKGNQGTLLWG